MPNMSREVPILHIMVEEEIDTKNVSTQFFDSNFWKLHYAFTSISYITIIFSSPAVCGWMCVDMKFSKPSDLLWWLKGDNDIRLVVTEYLWVLCWFFLWPSVSYILSTLTISTRMRLSIGMSQSKFQTLCYIPFIYIFQIAVKNLKIFEGIFMVEWYLHKKIKIT